MAGARSALTLKQFMLRQEVLKLYRTLFRTLRQLPDKRQQQETAAWVREDFKANKNIDPSQEDRIKALVYQGQKMLNELKNNVEFSKAWKCLVPDYCSDVVVTRLPIVHKGAFFHKFTSVINSLNLQRQMYVHVAHYFYFVK